MSNGSPGEEGATNGVRAAARDKARRLRTDQKKRDRRNRVLLRSGIVVGILAVAAIVAVVLVTSIHPPQRGPQNMASDGVLIGQGLKTARTAALEAQASPRPNEPDTTGQVVNIVTYVDYNCSYCGQFERTNLGLIGRLVNSGAATLEVHPLPFYANRSAVGDQYSLRAANAAACVADYAPDSFYAFNRLLFVNQPDEGKPGLTDAKLKSYASQANSGTLGPIGRCIDKRTYANWTQSALARAADGPLPNSDVKKLKTPPLVLVDGQQYQGSLTDADDFRQFIATAQNKTYTSSSPAPQASDPAAATPTSTPTAAIVQSEPTSPPASTPATPAP